MPRYSRTGTYQDSAGNVIAAATVKVYLTGTTTVANAYLTSAGGVTQASFTTDSGGKFTFWVDDADYAHTQLFDITCSAPNKSPVTFSTIAVYPPAASQILLDAVSGKTLNNLVDGAYSVPIKPSKIFGGATNTVGHTVPNIADDTFTLNAATQALTNKTINGNTVPSANDTVALLSATQTLLNKTLGSRTAPTVDIFSKGPFFDVRAYGAVGDGVTDDSTAFQNAINDAQLKGGQVLIPQASLRYLINTGLTFNVNTGSPLSMSGVGKYAVVIRYSGVGKFLSAVGGNLAGLQLYIRDFTLQLSGNNAVGFDMSQAAYSTVRNISFVAQGGATGVTGILANVSNNSWVPFFNEIEDCSFSSMASGIVLDSSVGNAPNRWLIIRPTVFNGAKGIVIGANSTQAIAGTDIIAPYFDQQSSYGIQLGSKADRTTIVAARQETAAGGTLFNIDNAANRTTILGYAVHAGATGTTNLGTRGFVVGIWEEGIAWTGSTLTTKLSLSRQDDGGIHFLGTPTNDAPAAGDVGEFVTATVGTGASIGLVSGATSTVTSMSLTAGDWDVWGVVDYTFGATTSVTNLRQGISITAATLSGQDTYSSESYAAMVPTNAVDSALLTPVVRVSIASTTTVYLVSNATFTISTLKAYGTINARRVR